MNVNRVKKLRLSLKLSQEELGERTNISQQLISKIENDDQKLTRDNMIVLADFFKYQQIISLEGAMSVPRWSRNPSV